MNKRDILKRLQNHKKMEMTKTLRKSALHDL